MCAEQVTTRVSGDGPRATKQDMREFWQAHPCGEIYASGDRAETVRRTFTSAVYARAIHAGICAF